MLSDYQLKIANEYNIPTENFLRISTLTFSIKKSRCYIIKTYNFILD